MIFIKIIYIIYLVYSIIYIHTLFIYFTKYFNSNTIPKDHDII